MSAYTDIKSIASANQCLAWWLVHSFLYYRAHQPILTDAQFDTINGWLKIGWNQVTHPHKYLVTMEDLNAGSGYAIRYPLSVESAAWQVLRDHTAKEPVKSLGKKAASPIVKAIPTPPKNDSLFDLM